MLLPGKDSHQILFVGKYQDGAVPHERVVNDGLHPHGNNQHMSRSSTDVHLAPPIDIPSRVDHARCIWRIQ